MRFPGVGPGAGGRLVAALLGAGVALVVGAVAAPDPEPRPRPDERYAYYWVEARAEGATPVRFGNDRLVFRAHEPAPIVRLTGAPEHPSSEVEVVVTNLNRDLVEPEGDADWDWIGPTALRARLVVPAGGSRELRFRWTEPDGPIRFLVASDPELNFALLERFLERARTGRPDFVFILGDLIQERPWTIDAYLEAFEQAEVPVYVAIGNHDLAGDSDQPPWEARKDEFVRAFGPRWREFAFRGVRFVILDNGALAMGSEQLDWLERTLAKGDVRARVVMAHKPFADPWGGEEHQIEHRVEKARLREMLARTPGAVYYCGHIEGGFAFESGGVPIRIVGSLTFEEGLHRRPRAGTNGYVEVEFDAAGERTEARVELEPPGRLERARAWGRWIAPRWFQARPAAAIGFALVGLAGAAGLAAAARGRWRRRAHGG